MLRKPFDLGQKLDIDLRTRNARTVVTSWITLIYRVLKNYVYNVSGMIEEVKTNMFLFDKTLAYEPFCCQMVLRVDGLTSVTTRTDQFCLCCCVYNKLKGSSRCQRRLATISTEVRLRLLSILVPQHTCNVETCLRLYNMAVSICCSALYTCDTSKIG